MASTCAAASTCSESGPPSLYLNNEKWKLSKKEGSSSSSRNRSSTSICPLMKKNSSTQRCAFARKCARLVKEQRARFYIMRRCVIMLLCWHEYNDS